MTRYWPTAVMALVLTALGLYLYLVEFPAKESQEREATTKKKLLTVDEQAITSLTFKTDREELAFERTPDKGWMLVKPIRTETDTREIQQSDSCASCWDRFIESWKPIRPHWHRSDSTRRSRPSRSRPVTNRRPCSLATRARSLQLCMCFGTRIMPCC